MWQDLVDQKDKWIGGKLIDHGDNTDRAIMKEGTFPAETVIAGFELTDDYFAVVGRDFTCGGARDILGLTNVHVEDGLAFRGYGGHRWDIVKPDGQQEGES